MCIFSWTHLSWIHPNSIWPSLQELNAPKFHSGVMLIVGLNHPKLDLWIVGFNYPTMPFTALLCTLLLAFNKTFIVTHKKKKYPTMMISIKRNSNYDDSSLIHDGIFFLSHIFPWMGCGPRWLHRNQITLSGSTVESTVYTHIGVAKKSSHKAKRGFSPTQYGNRERCWLISWENL